MQEPLVSRLRRRWPDVTFWFAFCVLAIAISVRNVRKNYKKDQVAMQDTSSYFDVSDFECFYRGALRMRRGELMYYPNYGTRKEEMYTALPPFQQLLLVPLTYLRPWHAEIVYSIVSWALLAFTLLLAGRLVNRVRGSPVSPWVTRGAFLLLIPFVALVGRYNQTGFFLVFPIVLGLLLLPRRAMLGGAVLALPAALKLLPIVVLPWLLWKRAWRASIGFVLCLIATTAAFYVYQGPELANREIRAYVEKLKLDRGFEDYNERYQGMPNMIRATITPKYESTLNSKAQEMNWDGVRNFLPSKFLTEHSNIVILLACGIIALGCALATRRRWPDTDRRRLAEIGLVLVAMLLISPHTWKHYYWYAFPAVLFVLLEATERKKWAYVALAGIVVLMTLPHRSGMPYLWMYFHVFHSMVWGLIVVWACLVYHLARQRAAVAETGGPELPVTVARTRDTRRDDDARMVQ